jgi:hypothetical protein
MSNENVPVPPPDNGDRRAHGVTVVGVVLAGVLASIVVPGPYDFGATMIGLTLLAVLYGYGTTPTDQREAVGLSAAVGICLLLVFGVLLDRVINLSDWQTRQKLDDYEPWWNGGWRSLLVWAVFTALNYVYWYRWLSRRTGPPGA